MEKEIKPNEDEKELFVSMSMWQLTQRHLASYSVINDSRQYIHLFEAIGLLRTIVGEKKIEEHYKEEYTDINNILISFGKKVLCINHYFDLLRDTDYRKSNVWKKTYRDFLSSLSGIPIIHTRIMGLLCFLIDQTPLKNKIPSDYISQASKDIIAFEVETDMEKKSLMFRKRQIESTEKKLEEDDEHKKD